VLLSRDGTTISGKQTNSYHNVDQAWQELIRCSLQNNSYRLAESQTWSKRRKYWAGI